MRVVVAYGTRPELIKLTPVVTALVKEGFEVETWGSGQQKDIGPQGVASLWDSFDTLACNVANVMTDFSALLEEVHFDACIVQGDTATAFACAQAAFLAGVPVAHVEAGMRTYATEPFPEEAFRRQIGAIAKWHFCPSKHEQLNLLTEAGGAWSTLSKTYLVGNTVIDTLPRVPFNVLVTLHRRENWGTRIQNALDTLHAFADEHESASITCVRHPNWTGHLVAPESRGRVAYVPPLSREELLAHVERAALVVTDSGGLQEEAAHFGVDCIVLRTSTERNALVAAGAVELCDPDDQRLLRQMLDTRIRRRRCYGSGDSAAQIASILRRELGGADAEA